MTYVTADRHIPGNYWFTVNAFYIKRVKFRKVNRIMSSLGEGERERDQRHYHFLALTIFEA